MSRLSRREFLAATAAGAGVLTAPGLAWPRSPRPVPSAAQLQWQRDELALFLHFGINTFTNSEWGDGSEDPALFDPTALDAGQWARSARAGGARAMILTAKHHDGFCLWPTRTTAHSVSASPWRGGRGDVVREFVDASAAEGLRAGLYCSPWDRNASSYGSGTPYNDFYCDQLAELLTGYGPIAEVWFDGANGEGPNGRRQAYDWPRFFALVHRLQPEAVIFSDAGPDIRWIGNEQGMAGDPNWSTVDPASVPYPGAEGEGVIQSLLHGDPAGSAWRPGETDTSIRPGWFYHPAEDGQVRTVEQLVELYFTSVGRNSKLLLNVPPTREGVLYPTDVDRLLGMRQALDRLFATDLVAGAAPTWRQTGSRTAETELQPGRLVSVGIVSLSEEIEAGQIVASYAIEGMAGGEWRPLSAGTTIGYRKLDRCGLQAMTRVRIRVEVVEGPPRPVGVRLYEGV